MFKSLLLSLITISLAIGLDDIENLLQVDGLSERVSRDLQNGEMGAINVGMICDGFMSSGQLDCECERSGPLDVKAECSKTQPQCTLDNSTCLEVRFETVRAPLTPDTQGSIYTTTCTNWIKNNSCAFEACLEVEPIETGNFDGQVKVSTICWRQL